MNRRRFFRNVGLGSLATLSLPRYLSALDTNLMQMDKDNSGKKVFLFQGDSITDGNRTRNNDWNHVMGHGYAYLIASRLWCDYPEEGLHFYNRGVSGDKLSDMQARWQKDTIDLKPDVLSILIGVNDVIAMVEDWDHESAEKFKERYTALLEQTMKQLPNTLIVLCEPFTLPLGWLDKKPAIWQEEIPKRQEIVKELSNTFNTLFVPLQESFNLACEKAPQEYWIWDGVHPMPAGHELIARKWIAEVKSELTFIR